MSGRGGPAGVRVRVAADERGARDRARRRAAAWRAGAALGVAFVMAVLVCRAGAATVAAEPGPGAPSAARWGDVFADEADTVVFLSRSSLVRAPFSMSGGETLWVAPGADRLARVLTSPDQRHLAWLSRPGDRGFTTLWLWDADGLRRRAAFAALRPSDYGVGRFDAAQPTLDDDDATGGRLAAASTMTRTSCSNAMVWDWSCHGLWVGYRDGVAYAPVDTASVRVMSPALALELHRLDPAPMLDAEVIRLGEGRDAAMLEQRSDYGRSGTGLASGIQDPNAPGGSRPRVEAQPGLYLLYPSARELRAFRVPGFGPSDRWTASETTVWWLDRARRVSAMRAHDPRPVVELEDRDPIVWLEYLTSRRALVRASGRSLAERPDSGGGDRRVLATGSPIRAVLAAPGDSARLVVTRDSLIVWDPANGSTRAVALDGAEPGRVLLAAAGTRVLVSGERHDAVRLDRLDPGGMALVPLGAPAVKKGTVVLTPSGRRLLLYPASDRGPRVIQVCDLAHASWSAVATPDGMLGWERVRP